MHTGVPRQENAISISSSLIPHWKAAGGFLREAADSPHLLLLPLTLLPGQSYKSLLEFWKIFLCPIPWAAKQSKLNHHVRVTVFLQMHDLATGGTSF